MPEKARAIYEELRELMPAEFDEGGSIGKRYRRQDEIGTPWGVTVDGQTMEDDTVTLRDRDSLEQVRLPIAALGDELRQAPERRVALAEDLGVDDQVRRAGEFERSIDHLFGGESSFHRFQHARGLPRSPHQTPLVPVFSG